MLNRNSLLISLLTICLSCIIDENEFEFQLGSVELGVSWSLEPSAHLLPSDVVQDHWVSFTLLLQPVSLGYLVCIQGVNYNPSQSPWRVESPRAVLPALGSYHQY